MASFNVSILFETPPKIDGGDKTAQKKFYDKLSRVARAWEQPNFDANKLFQFIEGYQAMLSLSSPLTDQRRYQGIKDSIDRQNSLYEKLLRDYDDLTAAVPQIGVSLVDIIVPYSLKSYGSHSESLSTERLTKVIAQLESAFTQDDGIYSSSIMLMCGATITLFYLIW